MGWTVGVDVGGTFTDFYLQDSETGSVLVHMRPLADEKRWLW